MEYNQLVACAEETTCCQEGSGSGIKTGWGPQVYKTGKVYPQKIISSMVSSKSAVVGVEPALCELEHPKKQQQPQQQQQQQQKRTSPSLVSLLKGCADDEEDVDKTEPADENEEADEEGPAGKNADEENPAGKKRSG